MRERPWCDIRIGSLGEVFTGRTPPTENSAYFGDDCPFITPSDMHQGKYARATKRGVSKEGAQLLKRIRVPANSVCVSCIGWQMGEAIMTDRPSFTNQQINTIVPNNNVEPSFLYYSLLPRKHELLSLGAMTGVRTPILNKSAFCDLKVKIPPMPVQQRIAGILSAYDDLIDNNTRRIKILEEIAQALYREWFVHFRFPGHENAKLVDGNIPRGWELKKLADVSAIVMGQSPRSEFYNESHEGLPFHQGVTNFGDRFPVDRIYCTVENRIAEEGDILCSVRAPVGRLNIAVKKIVIGRGLCAIRSKTDNQPFVFQQLREKFQEEDTMGGGTIFKSVTKDDMHGIEMVWPDEALLARFNEFVKPIFDELENLTLQSSNLRRTRDLLLPGLLSGEIAV